MKRILILSSYFTGHAHKSVSNALCERLEQYDDLEVRVIDGFELMNKVEQYMAARTYGPITRMPGKAWEWNYTAGEKLRKPVKSVVSSMIRTKLLALLEDFKPDAIVSVHPMFIGAVLDVLEEADLRIPLIAHAKALEMARWAPSAGKAQPCRAVVDGDSVHFYEAKSICQISSIPVISSQTDTDSVSLPARSHPGRERRSPSPGSPSG